MLRSWPSWVKGQKGKLKNEEINKISIGVFMELTFIKESL